MVKLNTDVSNNQDDTGLGRLYNNIANIYEGGIAPGRVELPTSGLGNRCSIRLSYGAVG